MYPRIQINPYIYVKTIITSSMQGSIKFFIKLFIDIKVDNNLDTWIHLREIR